MRKNTSVVFRSVESVNNRIDYLKRKGIKFKVYSSQYSTVIESNGQKIRYVTQVYDNRVFMCSKMLQNHLRDSDIEYIQSATWNTKNYDSMPGLKPGNYGKVINIDISGAYPNCLKNHGLTNDKVYSFLMDLGKKERLPAIGMIAKKTMVYEYDLGECLDVYEENGKYQKVFHYIVYQINKVMEACKQIAGKYYLLHWVDGIFLERFTPEHIVQEIKNVLDESKYVYKFEKVDKFEIIRKDQNIEIQMTKNGINKNYKFIDNNMLNLYNRIARRLNDDQPNNERNLSPDLQRSDSGPDEFFTDWIA